MSKKTAKVIILTLTILLISVLLLNAVSVVRALGVGSILAIPAAFLIVNLLFRATDVIDN